jgi:hypothetical protein
MEMKQFVYFIMHNGGSGYSVVTGSIDAEDRDTAIQCLWYDILRFDYEDDDFDGLVILYDTVKRERVYYYRG